MTRKIIRRKTSDNRYMHKDFHGALSVGITYIHRNFGADAVRDFLKIFARTHFAPLRRDLVRRGLSALRDHYERIYLLEGEKIKVEESPDTLCIEVKKCPAVKHMRKKAYPVARLFHETTKSVNSAICEGTPYSATLEKYNPRTGACIMRFRRIQP